MRCKQIMLKQLCGRTIQVQNVRRCKEEYLKKEELMLHPESVSRLCGFTMFMGELFLNLEPNRLTENSMASLGTLQRIRELIENEIQNTGFEIIPFKIGWYNDKVDTRFALSASYDTIGFLIVSAPTMFEKSFLPFICREECIGVKDPLDQCIEHYFQQIKKKFPSYNIESIHDYELHPNRRPKILVQTVAHISGAAYFYQRSDILNDPWDPKKKICGVCIHPLYGGWFALRGVLIFKNVQCPDLEQPLPVDCIPDQDRRIELLEKFNFSWQDWTYRDVCKSIDKYSDDQKLYFATPPKDRLGLIGNFKDKYSCNKV